MAIRRVGENRGVQGASVISRLLGAAKLQSARAPIAHATPLKVKTKYSKLMCGLKKLLQNVLMPTLCELRDLNT